MRLPTVTLAGGRSCQPWPTFTSAVSGANGGTECTGWVECSDLVTAGEDIIYQASSGVGPFNAANDPSSAWIGVYVYDENTVPVWTDAQFGEVPQD